jgi:hypothetical protein|tara:strand:+ start:2261 stop:3793 length:1533 start_codon:yes stop_codon:yes gene_type:complete
MSEKFRNIFMGLNIAYGKFVPEDKDINGKVKGKNQIVRCPDGIPEELWENHLDGTESLGAIPINENNECRWGCIDIDKYNGFDHLELITKIRKHGLPLIVFRSKSGGAHVFMFFTVPVKASLVQSRLKDLSSFLGCAGCEIFPKQVKLLLDKGQTGNYLNLPYFNAEDGERYAFDDEGKPCSLEQFYTLYDVYAQKNADVDYIKLEDFFEDGPPCLNTLHHNGVPEGGRDETMTNVAVFYKKSGKSEFLLDLLNVNKSMCDPSLTQQDIEKIYRSVSGKEYDYACNKEPLASNCNRQECLRRKYGKGQIEMEIAATGLEKYGTEPPLWFLSIEGEPSLELETEDLQNQNRFQKKCMEQLNSMPAQMPPGRWRERIQALLQNVSEPDVQGVSNKEIFIEHLRDWCTNKGAAQVKEEIILNKPYCDNGKHYFMLSSLEDHLQKKKFTVYNRNKMANILDKELKGKLTTLRMPKPDDKEKKIKVWAIPEFTDELEDIEIATPDMQDKKAYQAE